ncbi:hypothetical protein JW962_02825 [Candidatus Dojkabacteria bacterium]|nr:hypothetical protein [Candidatus Dojkabacteria bacterium]
MKKGLIIAIIAAIGLFVLLGCGLCGGGIYWFMNSMKKEAAEVRSGVLYDVCVILHEEDFEKEESDYFTDDFIEKADSHPEEVVDDLYDLFPEDFDCEDLTETGISDVFRGSVRVSIENDKKTVILKLNGKEVTVVSEDGDDFKIDDID